MTDKMPDEREVVEVRVEQDELFRWMLAAHRLDITLNEFAERALEHMVRNYRSESEVDDELDN